MGRCHTCGMNSLQDNDELHVWPVNGSAVIIYSEQHPLREYSELTRMVLGSSCFVIHIITINLTIGQARRPELAIYEESKKLSINSSSR